MRVELLVAAFFAAATACGRLNFDAGGDPGAVDSAPTGDSAPGADSAVPASCGGLPDTCGDTASEPCCDAPMIDGSAFVRSYDVAADGAYANMTAVATVSDFALDRYEITVGRFRTFVESGAATADNPPAAGAGAHPRIGASGWDPAWNADLEADTAALIAAVKCNGNFQPWTDAPGANENRPMNCITWFEAMAFCSWDGGHLPTEAEWNYAAAGGDEQRALPWSSPPGELSVDPDRASYNDGTDCVGDNMPGCDVTDLIEVGTKPAGDGRWGHADLAGNVWEWTLDWYDPTYPLPCDDCAATTPGNQRMVRGGGFGGFGASVDELRTGHRDFAQGPGTRLPGVGARCAR